MIIVDCFVIKCRCFNDLGESVMQQQDGLPFPWTTWVGFPLNFEGKQCRWLSHHTQVDYWSEVIEHYPLVMQQSLSQSEAFLPFRVGQPQPIRDFPTIEPGTLQCHNTRTYKKRCTCTSGSSLEVSQLVYTSGLYQSVALWLILHCSSQERRLPLRSSSHFKQ